MRANMFYVFGAFALAVSCSTHAQQAQSAVYILATADDPVGRQIVYEMRELVRRSAGLRLADLASEARFTVRLVTLDPDENTASSGISTVYSAVYTMRTLHETPVDMYLDNRVGTCGRNRVESCAKRMVAAIDEQAVQFRALLKSILESNGRDR